MTCHILLYHYNLYPQKIMEIKFSIWTYSLFKYSVKIFQVTITVKSANAKGNRKVLEAQNWNFSLGIQIEEEGNIYLNTLSRLSPLGCG